MTDLPIRAPTDQQVLCVRVVRVRDLTGRYDVRQDRDS